MTDQAARLRALDAAASFIVQAPAGSGKTELLIQRYLKLLGSVEVPEGIVAITFTRKAAGEMRTRILEALKAAASGIPPEQPHRMATFGLAQAALANDAQRQWRLLDNPARIRVLTIDALCASITRQMPWLARFGDMPRITEKCQDMYREAARNLLRHVFEEEEAKVAGPISVLLLHLDNDFRRTEQQIAQMLDKREQWLRLTGLKPDLLQVRSHLEQNLEQNVARRLEETAALVSEEVARELCTYLKRDQLPDDSAGWLEICKVVLTDRGTLRVQADQHVKRIVSGIRLCPGLEPALAGLRKIPPHVRFDESQWETLQALIEVLPRAVAELQLVFRERNRVDFAELSIRACEALGHLDSPSDLALALGYRIEHILVDEFQDTSFTQFDLLQKLTVGWDRGDGRTLFLVGDPMQSIYRFRQADVGLFLKARQEGIGPVRLEPLTLTTNYRSDPAIVDWVNQAFSQMLPQEEDITRGAVAYTSSLADRKATPASLSPVVHPFFNEAHEEEADRVISLVQNCTGSVAILVRARSALASILGRLRQRGLNFQAVEIDQLGERAIIQDLMALTFALAHAGDRISWLAILRAPWCGLTIEDLHSLAASDAKSTIWDLLHSPNLELTADGASRLTRCLPVLEEALLHRGRVPLRRLVENTWLNLGGPACTTDTSDLEDASAYFDLLEGLEEGGDLEKFEVLREQVAELFAQPDADADGRLQIMTIHKAKGLEFDTVILPGLGRATRPDDENLLAWHEEEGELLLAPISASGQDSDPIYKYIKRLGDKKTDQECARLLYVAATRARDQLHLLGCASLKAATGEPTKSGLLKHLWPAVQSHFVSAASARAGSTPQVPVPPQQAPARPIHRLPIAWSLPAAPARVRWENDGPDQAQQNPISFEWVGDSLRHAGTVVHAYLLRIANEGLGLWPASRIASCRPAVRSMLANLGVPPIELAATMDRVEKALLQTTADARGRWILEPHAEAACEYAVSGVVDGGTCTAIIDRTFIDDQGVRWIIDYKSSSHEGGGLDNFLEQERKRYQPQLEKYARLLAQKEDRPIRLALYFPLLNAWREWAAPTLKRRQASFFE